MPAGDRTGPVGNGPMTGRGAGICSGAPNQFTRGFGMGFGRRGGMGRGGMRNVPGAGFFRQGFNVQYDEPAALKAEAEALKERLAAIEEHLKQE